MPKDERVVVYWKQRRRGGPWHARQAGSAWAFCGAVKFNCTGELWPDMLPEGAKFCMECLRIAMLRLGKPGARG